MLRIRKINFTDNKTDCYNLYLFYKEIKKIIKKNVKIHYFFNII